MLFFVNVANQGQECFDFPHLGNFLWVLGFFEKGNVPFFTIHLNNQIFMTNITSIVDVG
jgi:hypothetical protein